MGSEDHHRGLKVLVKLGEPGQGRRQCDPTRYSAVPAYDTDHRTTILVFCFASYLKFRSFRTRQVYFGIDVVCGQVHVRGLSLLFFGIEAPSAGAASVLILKCFRTGLPIVFGWAVCCPQLVDGHLLVGGIHRHIVCVKDERQSVRMSMLVPVRSPLCPFRFGKAAQVAGKSRGGKHNCYE